MNERWRMKGWTKGPYEVVGSRVCTVGNDRTRVAIADTRPGSAFAMNAEQEANAKLLAMAPEMARALQGW